MEVLGIMESQVENMYENCNIKPKQEGYCDWDSNCPYPHHKCNDECPYWKHEDIAKYPPFTAEKQLELIKWLGELDMLEIMRTTREDKAWIINSEYGMSGNVYKHTSRMKSFEEALAELINSLWQDLTDAERKQIKEILSE